MAFKPDMILAGRRINDGMGNYVASQVSKLMTKKRINLVDANILIMGLSFKENSRDIRNTGVVDLVTTLQSLNCNVDIFDPLVDKNEAMKELNLELIKFPDNEKYDAIVIAVAHDEFEELSISAIKKFAKKDHVIYDVKYLLDQFEVDGRL